YGILVVAQIGLALALLSGAAIIFRQAWRVSQLHFGYDPRPLAEAVQYFKPPPGPPLNYATFSADVVSRVRSDPEVADAAVEVGRAPAGHAVTITDPGGGVVEIPAGMWGYSIVSTSYFRTFRLPIVAGRDLLDGERDVPVAIVDKYTAHSLWPNSDPVGSMIKLGEFKSTRPWIRVVGVAGQQHNFSEVDHSARADIRPSRIGAIYVVATLADTVRSSPSGFGMRLVARARTSPERLPLSLRRALHGL